MVTYPGHPEWTEVFNLEADPYEISNLADQPETRATLTEKLRGTGVNSRKDSRLFSGLA